MDEGLRDRMLACDNERASSITDPAGFTTEIAVHL